MVHRAELHRAELRDQLVHDMKFIGVVGLRHRGFQRGELAQDPAVESAELVIGHGLGCRIEVVQVGELVAQGIADEAVGFTHLLEPLLADHDVAAVVLRGDPQAHDIATVVLNVAIGRLRLLVTALTLLGLGDFLAVLIDHEAVGQHRLERGRTIARQRQ